MKLIVNMIQGFCMALADSGDKRGENPCNTFSHKTWSRLDHRILRICAGVREYI